MMIKKVKMMIKECEMMVAGLCMTHVTRCYDARRGTRSGYPQGPDARRGKKCGIMLYSMEYTYIYVN